MPPSDEVVNPRSGEVMRNPAGLTPEELLDYEPASPAELEQIIRHLSNRLETAVPAIKELWAARYDAERKFIEERAKAMMRSTQSTVARQRAEADIASLQYKHEFDNAKVILHGAEELQKALTAKLYGYLNINKTLGAAYQSSGYR